MGYAIRWRGDRLLYFEHPPPQFGQITGLAPSDYPKAPYVGAPLEQHSIYYWWWAFLRENALYQSLCDAHRSDQDAPPGVPTSMFRVFSHFRDLGSDFRDWWDRRNGRLLFCSRLERTVYRHKIDAQGRVFIGERSNRMVISFPTDGDRDRIRMEVEKLLDYYWPNPSSGSIPPPRYAVLGVRPRTPILHHRLEIYKLLKLNKSISNQMIASTLGLNWDPSTISREKARAERMVDNVGLGQFPAP